MKVSEFHSKASVCSGGKELASSHCKKKVQSKSSGGKEVAISPHCKQEGEERQNAAVGAEDLKPLTASMSTRAKANMSMSTRAKANMSMSTRAEADAECSSGGRGSRTTDCEHGGQETWISPHGEHAGM